MRPLADRWRWYAAPADDADEFSCEQPTREATLAEAVREFGPGTPIVVIQAVMSEDRRYEGHDMVPFIRTRNREELTLEGGAE